MVAGVPPSGGCARLPVIARAEFGKAGAVDEAVQVLQREDPAAGREQQLLHVFAADLEAPAPDAGDDLESGRLGRCEIPP